MTNRRSYARSLTINGRSIDEVSIDAHYAVKHPDISDAIILELVKELDGKEFEPDEASAEWQFVMLDRIEYHGRRYRLVWCMPQRGRWIGVINCFRR